MKNTKTILGKIDKYFFSENAASTKMEDTESITEKKGELYKAANKGLLKRYISDIMTLFSLINDYVHRRYTTIPFKVISAVTFAIIYILNPIDLIPDIIPVVGQLDDLAVLTICLTLIEEDLNAYKSWKEMD